MRIAAAEKAPTNKMIFWSTSQTKSDNHNIRHNYSIKPIPIPIPMTIR